jgi:hypothetical protein
VGERGKATVNSTRHVRHVHRVPAYGQSPFGWLHATLRVAAHEHHGVLFPTQEQVAVLGAAQTSGRRTSIIAELWAAVRHTGSYHDSSEELTPVSRDWRSLIPVVAASGGTLIQPAAWRRFSSGAVSGYALTPRAWQQILDHPPC